MSIPANLNPDMLRWAREQWSLDMDQAASKLGLTTNSRGTPSEQLAALESGAAELTQLQLEDVAKRYRLPITVFYLSSPPAELPALADFRLFPGSTAPSQSGLLNALINELRAKQQMVREVLVERNDGTVFSLPAVDSSKVPMQVAADVVNECLGESDRSAWSEANGADSLFRVLRSRIEDRGVVVNVVGSNMAGDHQFRDNEFRGLALLDDVVPFVAVNGLDASTAQVVTLVHEFVHVITRTPGVSNTIGNDADVAGTRAPERYCNEVAVAFLLPGTLFMDFRSGLGFAEAQAAIESIVKARHVSRQLVALRLRKLKGLDNRVYRQLVSIYQKEAANRAPTEPASGPDASEAEVYYPMKIHALGRKLISIIGTSVRDKRLSLTRAASILDVHPANVTHLLKSAGV